MELRDLVVTPIVLFVVYLLAYIIRPHVTDHNTSRYFIPALTVKIIGAIAVGVIYQFYYGGGDTFAFHTHGSRVIWEAFMESFDKGLKLLFAEGEYTGIYEYASRIWYFRDPHSYFVIKIAAVIDLLTFSAYSATAVLFAAISFSGMWALFLTFQKKYPDMHFWLAVSVLFVPTVFFWGSGILKDTITLGALGWLTYAFDHIFIRRKLSGILIFILILSAYIIYSIKIYILLSFLPAVILWFFVKHIARVRQLALKMLIAPVVLTITGILGYYAILEVGEDNAKYRLDNIAETAMITAYDIRYGWGARDGVGAGYNLGELDGTFAGMVMLAPAAINVSLFRPYLWEVENPLMLLSAIEAAVFLFLTLLVIYKAGAGNFIKFVLKPDVVFCLTFALVFAFAVGISTYNFGSLSRYKIPMMPFYLVGLCIMYYEMRTKDQVNAKGI